MMIDQTRLTLANPDGTHYKEKSHKWEYWRAFAQVAYDSSGRIIGEGQPYTVIVIFGEPADNLITSYPRAGRF